jgi:glycosyltransferase involved in cell wall biosynthesis
METDMIKPLSAEQASHKEPSGTANGAAAAAPLISVIVPVRNSPAELRLCLERLFASTHTSFEVIVVDDASTDETAQVAVELRARLLPLKERCGPAQARNRGAEIARGEYLFFLDADVCVRPETLHQIAGAFAHSPDLDAVFGSYDTQPTARNVLSQYKNLFHHFFHQDSNARATTFWSGCGALRRSVFQEMGGFDTSYGRPCIEDIELGARMHRTGHRILLDKKIQVTHLKRWTLWSMVKTDVLDRGIPWTELMLRERQMPNNLNTKYSQRMCVLLAYGLLVVLGIGVWYYRQLLFAPVGLLLIIAFFDYWSVKRRFCTLVRLLTALTGLGLLALIGYTFKWWPLLPLALIVGIVAINSRFYAFFLAQRHQLLLILVFPLHLLYYFSCGVAFCLGVGLYVWKKNIYPTFPRGTPPRSQWIRVPGTDTVRQTPSIGPSMRESRNYGAT